jgi:hypothetical protein
MIPAESRPTCYAWTVDSTEGSQIRVVDHVLFIYAILLINSKRYSRKERTQSPRTQTNYSERTYVRYLITEDAPNTWHYCCSYSFLWLSPLLQKATVMEAGSLLVSSVVSYFCYDFVLIKAFLRHLSFSQLCCRIFKSWGLWRLFNQWTVSDDSKCRSCHRDDGNHSGTRL